MVKKIKNLYFTYLCNALYRWYERTECRDKHEDTQRTELTLSNVAGIFYILIGGLLLALSVALAEFCCRTEKTSAVKNKHPDISIPRTLEKTGLSEFEGPRLGVSKKVTSTSNKSNKKPFFIDY